MAVKRFCDMTYDSDALVSVLEDIAKSLRLLSGRESLRDEFAAPLMKEKEMTKALLDAVTSQLPDDMQRKVLNNAQQRQNDKREWWR